MSSAPRPGRAFDAGLQHERTSLAWERTAIAMMAAGVLLARFAAQARVPAVAVGGVVQTLAGAAVLVWAEWHYDDRHRALHRGDAVVHPVAARRLGGATVVFSGVALGVAVYRVL